ncbi:hypothetical protein LOTGIDRAFT_235866 [Lottia gigantea]|uniref:DIS3-like exonuclease 2 n=1 Tax=Lottia gigantea TaxID=225164 RepID=V4B8T0_LOTGI|nr:hypothetical protein LOTGIDRAFT_235866 [Lottia gigantea]ESO85209.1 hypothetical protein LOTGIDRAFT_235866 [Lottia gigantea]
MEGDRTSPSLKEKPQKKRSDHSKNKNRMEQNRGGDGTQMTSLESGMGSLGLESSKRPKRGSYSRLQRSMGQGDALQYSWNDNQASGQSGAGHPQPKQNRNNVYSAGNRQQRNFSDKADNRSKTAQVKKESQRKQGFKFEEYWSREELSAGFKRHELIEGKIRINPKNFTDAYVAVPNGKNDIYICGLLNRNRALNGDIVAVQILDRDNWRILEQQLESYESSVSSGSEAAAKGGNSSDSGEDSGPDVIVEGEEIVVKNTNNSNNNRLVRDKFYGGKSYTSVKDVVTSGSPAAKGLFKDKTKNERVDSIAQKVGKVVGILERKHSRAASGYIKLMEDKNPQKALFAPFDSRVPRLIIPMSECPKDFYERPNDYATNMFIARIVDWPAHSKMPHGNLSRSIGEAGLIEPETEALLIENDVDFSDFSEEAIKCLPTVPWKIPENEYKTRRDFRKECVFTIDPATARDLDDAVSCRYLGNDTYEVGVHIADVSYFVDAKTELDTVASERATSVYLTQKVIPMLPRLLCEELCSLNPDKDRLTFSVCWHINSQGEISKEWFGRSVIKSCVKLSYNHAQGFIENPDREWKEEELPPISEGFTVEDIKSRTLILHKIAKCLRKYRFDQGALRLDQVKLQFSLDDETGLPNGYTVYEQRDSNRLIEEYMLLANMAVAHKINSSFPEKAILRCHPAPQSRMIQELKDTCQELGIDMDVSSSQAIHQSIMRYVGNDEYTTARMQVLVAMCSKPMQIAKYFCAGMYKDEEDYRHYALNVPLYTHFTSPIRRYPDILVHRLLAASLDYCEPLSTDKEDLQKIASHCNDKKTNAKTCSETSNDIFFAVFVKEAGPFEEKGMVMAVLDRAFDVFILKLGVVKRVYCDKLEIKDKAFDKGSKVPKLTLTWPSTEENPEESQQEITLFTLVDCVLKADNEPLKWTAYIKRGKD